MRNICLVLEYDGTNFNGFQIQPDEHIITVQGEIQRAIEEITGIKTKIYGAGRTDTGVSAEQQYANFFTESKILAEKFKFALNTKLPPEISINKSFEVPHTFHSRHSAIRRTYRYRILNSPTRSAVRRNSVYQSWPKLDFELMKKAWLSLRGEHDFSAFCISDTDRLIMKCEIFDTSCHIDNDELVFFITGDTFLRGMVRLLIGTLIHIGKGKLKPEELMEIVKNKQRERVVFSVPASGLSLIKIEYPEESFLFS